MPGSGSALLSALAGACLLSACHQAAPPISLLPDNESADLRITEAPWEPQERMSRRMQHLTTFIHQETGLKVRYVPAINYVHSYSLVERGEADLILVGIFGGYRLMKRLPHAIPLVVQKPSYRMVMLGRRSWLESLPPDAQPGLSSIEGSRVGFGSRFSGSAFMQPMLALQEAGMDASVIAQCLHEPVQRHLPTKVANGLVDFVFVPSHNGQKKQFISESLRDELVVAWVGRSSRNDYLISAVRPDDLRRQEYLKQVQRAFLSLDRTSREGRAVLDAYMFPGFELPTPEFPAHTNQRIDVLLSTGEGLPTCEAS